jgi:hypothetical protein
MVNFQNYIQWPKTPPKMATISGHSFNIGEVGVTGHNFESWPPKDHSCHVCFKLTYWFQRRRLLNIFYIGSYVKIKSSHGFRFLTLQISFSYFTDFVGFCFRFVSFRFFSFLSLPVPSENGRIVTITLNTNSAHYPPLGANSGQLPAPVSRNY